MATNEKEAGAEFLVKLAESQGIACATVKNGHVLIFTKKHIEALLGAMLERGQEKCVVFVKRPDFQN